MAQATHGIGGLKYDASKRARPPELNVFVALLLIVAIFEVLGRLVIGDSFLFDTTSTLNVAMRRCCNLSSNEAESERPGKRKNGATGAPAAVATAANPRSISAAAAAGFMLGK